MKILSRLKDHRYCAFCRTPRRVYAKKHVDLTNVLAMMLLALAATQAYYGSPDPRGILLFGLLIVLAEVFVYLRWRSGIACKMCGFDPVIYKRSPEQAAAGVREFFQEQMERPEFMLSKSPLVEVRRRLIEQEKKRLELEIIQKRKSSSLSPTKSV